MEDNYFSFRLNLVTTELISRRLLLMGYRIFGKAEVEGSKIQEVETEVEEVQGDWSGLLNPVVVRVKKMHVETSLGMKSEGSVVSQGESEKSSSLHLDDFSDSGVLTRSSRSNLEELIAKVSL